MRFSLPFFFRFLLAIFICQLSAPAARQAQDMPVTLDFARHGEQIICAIQYEIPAEYHSYAHKPGGAGKPTIFDFTLENAGAMPVLYPSGIEEPDIFDRNVMTKVYIGPVTLLALMPDDSSGKLYAASLDMLLCSNKHCLPFKHSSSGQIPKNIPLLNSVPWVNAANQLLASEKDSSGALSLEEGSPPPPRIENASPPSPPDVKPDASVLDAPEDFNLNLHPVYDGGEIIELYSLARALFLGMIAGLLLNAMPCVLPVLSLKVAGLLLAGNINDKIKLRQFRSHNLWFAAGILSLFTLLALILGMADLIWGQLYQNQTIILVMLIIVFLMGLSMLGVFTLPVIDPRIEGPNPRLQSYATGFVSTFLATPCSGPLLGGVLAWAFTQPLAILISVFWSVGLGMSIPYIVFALWPKITQILPRPGKWMYVFEHILGFFLLGTALYLLSILPADKHITILTVLLLASLYAWLWGKFCDPAAPRARRAIMGAFSVILLCGAIYWITKPAAPAPQWQIFSPELFTEDFGKKPLLVEFTADWCPNCKFVEATALTPGNLKNWQRRYKLNLIRVDLTSSNPYAERLLEMLGSRSIPLTAIFPAGDEANRPVVLRDIYGAQRLENALHTALDSK